MSTDDRDIESSNPSKNFKVGDFDQLSGFFTPVWESKRRIRSEPPAPPSSKGGSNRPPASSKSAALPGTAASTADAPRSAEEPANAKASKGVPRPRASSRNSAGKGGGRSSAARAPTPVPPAPSSERSSPTAEAVESASILLPPAVAEVFSPPMLDAEGDPPLAIAEATLRGEGAADAARPAEAASASPSAAARALRDAGPNLPPAAFLDEEPEFRSPRAGVSRAGVSRPERSDRPVAQYRAQLASSAAARVHEQLKAKLQAEAAEIDESRFERDPETNRDPLSESAEDDPFPLSLMRRLRRTIRLSTPVPDPVRSLISKYDRG